MYAALPLSEGQRAAIEQALEGIQSHIVSRGAQLMRERAVRKLQWDDAQEEIKAQVQGGQLYKTWVSFVGDKAHTECTCPYGINCKHGVAVLLELRKSAVIKEELKLRQPLSRMAEKAEAKLALKKQIAGELEETLMKLLDGKVLPAKARQVVSKLEPLWAKRTPAITESELHALGG